jgi:hypothetical protein
MMHGRGKSASAIVAAKPTNNAGRPVSGPVQRRAETKGNADQQSTRRVQDREGVTLGSHSRFVRLATGRWLRPSNSMLRVGFRTPH